MEVYRKGNTEQTKKYKEDIKTEISLSEKENLGGFLKDFWLRVSSCFGFTVLPNSDFFPVQLNIPKHKFNHTP